MCTNVYYILILFYSMRWYCNICLDKLPLHTFYWCMYIVYIPLLDSALFPLQNCQLLLLIQIRVVVCLSLFFLGGRGGGRGQGGALRLNQSLKPVTVWYNQITINSVKASPSNMSSFKPVESFTYFLLSTPFSPLRDHLTRLRSLEPKWLTDPRCLCNY